VTRLWQCPWSIMNMFLWVIFSPQFWVIFHVVSERLCCFGMFLGKIKGKWVLKSDTVWRGHVSWHHLRTANLRTHTKKNKCKMTKYWAPNHVLLDDSLMAWYFASESTLRRRANRENIVDTSRSGVIESNGGAWEHDWHTSCVQIEYQLHWKSILFNFTRRWKVLASQFLCVNPH